MQGKGGAGTGRENPEMQNRCRSTLSLTSVPDGVGGQRHALAALTPGRKPGTHYIEGWV